MHRRDFVKRSGLLVGSTWVAGQSASRGQDVTVRERPNIATLDPNGPEITDLKKAVLTMKQRSKLDLNAKTGWIGQARIHLDACPHGNWFFLPWHRAYVHFFEQVCREACGNSNFMLPFWDWTTHPTLPEVFWGNADNPLNHPSNNPNFPGPHRGRSITADQPIPSEFVGPDVIKGIFDNGDFISAIGSDPAPKPRPDDNDNRAQSTLEGTPHNNVHGEINGDMGNFWSPRDPIFWLHHANIDRLWALWADRYPNAFPNNNDFLKFPMNNFVDPAGNDAGLTVRETLSTRKLGYQYPGQKPEPQELAGNTLRVIPASLRVAATVEAAASRTKPLQINLSPPEPLRVQLANVARVDSTQTASVKISGIEKQLPVGAYVRVFLNCDYLAPSTPTGDVHYVSSFSFFGHGGGEAENVHGHSMKGNSGFYLNLSGTIQSLVREQQFDPQKLRVGLVVKARPGSELPDQTLELKPGQVEVAVVNRNRDA